MFLELLPGLALDNPHLDEDWSEKVVATCFDQCLGCHATSASHGEFENRSIKSLTSSPSFCLVRRRVCMLMSASSSKKQLTKRASKSSQHVIEPFGSLRIHSKATPLRVLMNSRVRTGSFPIRLPVCDWK